MRSETDSIFRPVLLIWLAGSAVLLLGAWQNISSLSGWDPDDQLRMVQLRDFLAGQGWFDNSQNRLNTPFGTDMHWSRITELPLALIVLLFTPLFGQSGAEMVAGTFVPLALLFATGYFLSDIARRIGHRDAVPIAMLLCFLIPTILAQFMPMRIDHHGWQIMMASASIWTLFCEDRRKGGLMLGAALALWLHISIEGAPLTAVFFAYLGLRWILRDAQGQRLLFTLISFAPLSVLLFLATKRNGFATINHCDIISPAHLMAIGGAAGVMVMAILLKPASWSLRAALAAFAGAAALWLLHISAPACLTGGFADLDPVVRSYWYVNVTEGLALWQQGKLGAIGWIMAAIMGLIGLVLLKDNGSDAQRSDRRMIGWFQIAALVISLLVMRAAAVACAFAIPVLANWLTAMIDKYRGSTEPMQKAKTAILMMLIVMAGPIMMQLANRAQAAFANGGPSSISLAKQSNKECSSTDSVASLAALENARIVAPFDIGPAILLTTDHSVLASSHHRNNAGMRDQIEIFRSSPEQAEKIIRKRGITHIAICPGEAEMRQYQLSNPNGLWAQIETGKIPVWLRPIEARGKGIQLWEIRSAKLR